MPRALASVPPSIKVDTIVDRTTTIQASVHDVEFTLLLTIALVVMVIFLFLRNFWATVIPGVTVPLALLGTAALMYAVGYTLDNLSLMGLTIAVGFVVDDAIVMLENIYRHIEEGLSPMEAALKGSREIGFTILSISLSLVAVFIPLLLMGGIIGRLFREFAVTVTMTILVSAFVSLTLSPMMCSLFLRDERAVKHGRAYQFVERGFEWLLNALHARTGFRAEASEADPDRISADGGAVRGVVRRTRPRDFSRSRIPASSMASPMHRRMCRLRRCCRLQHELMDIVAKDPDVATSASFLGGSRPVNNGFVIIGLKPRDERNATARRDHHTLASASWLT